jgi:hypothetical protein
MRKKYCTLLNKTVYAKTCIDCGRLTPTEQPIKLAAGYETKGWECEHLFEKVVFKGHTNQWRKSSGRIEPPVGTMEKYQYRELEISLYSSNS